MTVDIDTPGPVAWLAMGRRVVRMVADDAVDAGWVSASARQGGF